MADNTTVDLSERSLEQLARMTGSNLSRPSAPSSPLPSAGGAEAVTGFISALRSGGSSLVSATSQTLDGWRRASDIGIGFNNDAIGLRSSVGETRLSVEEWDSVIRRGSFGLTALNGTMSDSARVFNRMSRDFSDSSAADELRRLGWTEKEYNDVLALSLVGRKNLDMQDANSKKAAIEAAAELASEMDKMSKLTGKSRQELMNEQAERNRDVRLQAAINAEVRKGGEDAKKSYDFIAQSATGAGIESLARAMYAGRGLTQREQNQYSILGDAGAAYYRAINDLKAATLTKDPTQIEAAKAQLKSAEAQVIAMQKSERYQQFLIQNMGDFTDAAVAQSEKAFNYQEGLDRVAKELGLDLSRAGDAEKARAELERRINNERKGLDAAGNPIAGANVTATAVETSARIKDTAAALWKNAEALNTQIGQSKEVILLLRQLANRKDIGGTEVSSRERGGLLPESTTKISESISAGTLSKDLPGILKNSVVEGFQSVAGPGKELLVNMAKVGGQSAVDFFKSITGAVTTPTETPTPGRAGGSLGAVGKLIEDFGNETMVRLHGKEGVITENQLGSLFNGFKAQMGAVQNPTNQLVEQLITTVSKAQPEVQKVQVPTPAALPAVPALDGIQDQLNHLNTMMSQLLSYTSDVANNTGQQVRATKKLSGNALA